MASSKVMRTHLFLSMPKAIEYLGDLQSTHPLLKTLNSSLEKDTHEIAHAIETHNFEVLQKILHQLKGFAPVFCQDILVAEITRVESLCKAQASPETQLTALQASADLLLSLKALQVEVTNQLSAQPEA
jgi:HPt (histidine-containing phosphotransfer) domain-containing protein